MTYHHIVETGYPVSIPKPGQTVVALLDESQTPLTVLRVEPLIVASRPDGTEVTLYAHEVEILEAPGT